MARWRKKPAWLAEPTGFERMVTDVCLGEVRPVAAREVLRFARNSNDWQQPIRPAFDNQRRGPARGHARATLRRALGSLDPWTLRE